MIRRDQQTERDREIVSGSLLGLLAGCEVHRDVEVGPLQMGADNRAAHPATNFPGGRFCEPDDMKTGQTRAEVDFYGDGRGLESGLTAGANKREVHRSSLITICWLSL